jgi:fimbrial chaperone protein
MHSLNLCAYQRFLTLEARPWFWAVVLCGGLELLSAPAHAGGVSVYPLKVILPANGTTAEFHVSNPSNEAAYVRVSAVEWRPLDEIKDAPIAPAILAAPPIFDLEPGGSQLVRLAGREAIDDGVERAYRLIVTEVPKTAGLLPNTLAIATRMSLPVFITPEGATPAPNWSIETQDFDRPALVLTNLGGAHLDIKKVSLLKEANSPVIFATENGGHVLAGQKKEWPLDVALERLKGPILVKADTNTGPIEATISFPGG